MQAEGYLWYPATHALKDNLHMKSWVVRHGRYDSSYIPLHRKIGIFLRRRTLAPSSIKEQSCGNQAQLRRLYTDIVLQTNSFISGIIEKWIAWRSNIFELGGLHFLLVVSSCKAVALRFMFWSQGRNDILLLLCFW